MLSAQLNQDLVSAQKSRDEIAVSTIRMVISSINNAKIAKGGDLSEDEVLSEIAKDVKRHKESIEAYKSAGRDDLVGREVLELEVLQGYLPQQLSDEDLSKIVDEAITAVSASGIADMGKVIKAVMTSVGARADGAKVAGIVKSKLAPNS